MKIFKIIFFSTLLLYSYNSNAKNIAIIATGGTISGAGESSIESKYSASKVDIDKIIKTIPGITDLANIKSEQLLQVNSQDMNDIIWLKIAHKVNKLLSKNSVDGVVITHGTDTLEETAYFLNLAVKSKKPVVLVGSMRPSTSLSADGYLYNAVALASNESAINQGVLVLLNNEIYAARDVVANTHPTNVASFKSNSGAIGQVHYGKTDIYYRPLRLHTAKTVFNVKKLESLPKVGVIYLRLRAAKTVFNVKKLESLPKVDVIYSHAAQDAGVVDYYADVVDYVDYLVKSGSKAIIVAGVGDGNIKNINQEVLKSLVKAKERGVIIVRSSRLGSGIVVPNSEINDRELGFVTADNLSPQKARILAMMALTKTNDVEKIRKMFKTY